MSSSSWWYGSCAIEHRFFGGKPFSATSLSYPVKRKLSIGLVLEFSSINGEMSRPFEYSFTKLGKRTFKNLVKIQGKLQLRCKINRQMLMRECYRSLLLLN